MVTQKGDNTAVVVGIHGNFDQAQSGVKKMFAGYRALAEETGKMPDISFLLRTLSISDVWFRRSFIMYMHMQNYMQNGEIAKDEEDQC